MGRGSKVELAENSCLRVRVTLTRKTVLGLCLIVPLLSSEEDTAPFFRNFEKGIGAVWCDSQKVGNFPTTPANSAIVMAGPSWLVDSNRIATKIKSASGTIDPKKVDWKSNPTRTCPSCQHVIDNSDVVQQWPGLPQGVKFDPSDQEIIWHLLAKNCREGFMFHPFIDEFIQTVNEDVGICYTHPRNLPGVKQDGRAVHFFHRAIKAYNTGSRKRRKISDDDADVRWHKTGRTKPVILDGVQKGCKKIMVLYASLGKGGKSEKTNWVMHQYHLGTEEDEKDGEYVISKILFQQQQLKLGEKGEQDAAECFEVTIAKVDPVTPKSITPDPPRNERLASSNLVQNCATSLAKNEDAEVQGSLVSEVPPEVEVAFDVEIPPEVEAALNVEAPPEVDVTTEVEVMQTDCEVPFGNETDQHENVDDIDNHIQDDHKWWDSESQNMLDSQQLVEGISFCDEFLASQSPNRDGSRDDEYMKSRPRLSDYVHLGPENLKKDLEECQNLVLDPANIELDTPPEFRLSQLEFGSQDSYLAWGVGKTAD